ncbi:MAG TPA: hypothetical protein QF572_17880 [Vicinamibacterales bacterium]|nr:hypothetical protein [Vicinamibacterales bacterium]
MKQQAALIYLADLTHTGLRVATEGIPLNIGLVAAYAKKVLGPAIEVRLFKYPEPLIDALKERPPQILGCSNYVWNSNLSQWMLGHAKSIDSQILTVQGGTNYPFLPHLQTEFLRSRRHTDFHTFYEAEIGFVSLVKRFLESTDTRRLREQPIPGVHFLSSTGDLVDGGQPELRLKALDEVPSPYLAGMLDHFFDGQLIPMMETTRGCPFTCNFCNAGDTYYNRVNVFSLDYVRDELNYIAPRIANSVVTTLWLADNNFGMLERDAEVSRLIRHVQERYGWPLSVTGFTGKNNKARILKTTEVLGKTFPVSMSVQSMNGGVLENIKRQNVSVETYRQVNQALQQQGRVTHAEVISCLPGESYESYVEGVRELIDGGTDRLLSYALLMNHGTDYKDSEYCARHGYETKWRLITLDFGRYDGQPVFDVEEVAVQTKDLPFEDYVRIRGLAFVIESLYNDAILVEIVKYLREHGVLPFEWLTAVSESRRAFPPDVREVFQSFDAETRAELFDSESDVAHFYGQPENYARLLQGEIGGNVLFKHKARLMTSCMSSWVEHAVDVARHILRARGSSNTTEVERQMAELGRYVKLKLRDAMKVTTTAAPIAERFEFDFLAWLRDPSGKALKEFYCHDGIEYTFRFDDQQIVDRRNNLRRYGSDPDGLAKIIMRVSPLSRLFRNIAVTEQVAQRWRGQTRGLVTPSRRRPD